MIKHVIASTVIGIVASCAAGQSGAAEPEGGFVAIFNGHDLSGWWGCETENPRAWMALQPEALAEKKKASLDDIHEHWTVEGDELVNDGHGLYLTTDKNYADFELVLDYKTVAGADSGIYLRGIPQVQIWDTTEAGGKWNIGADKGSGGLWNNSAGAAGKDPLVHADKPFGEWNHFRVVMAGERVSVWLNNELVVDHARLENYFDRSLPVPRVGPIQLQTHGGEIRWRSVRIREIGADEANAILKRHGVDKRMIAPAEFETVFNGRDFKGWSGPVGSYEIVDGAIRCKPHEGGTIYTDEVYDNFVVQFEFLLPPGGNNGLAIRYPGQGDTAYAGMCELQVLDSEAPQYAKLDPRQYHGSAYGQWPAQRGYLRQTGLWNFQEVTVNGQRITVELNGTVILDKDTSEITEFMYEPDKFHGRTRIDGHFGFAGHSDPVAFREVRIKRIEK